MSCSSILIQQLISCNFIIHLGTKGTIVNAIKCFLTHASLTDPKAGFKICGTPQIDNVWTTYMLVLYSSFFAGLPFFVFGFHIYFSFKTIIKILITSKFAL